MRIHRFFALVIGALTLTMTSAHVLEMPAKLSYDIDLYRTVNGTLYREFAIVGAAYTVFSILVVGTLAGGPAGGPRPRGAGRRRAAFSPRSCRGSSSSRR